MKSSAEVKSAKEEPITATHQELPRLMGSTEQTAPLAMFRQKSGLDIRDSIQQICDTDHSRGRERLSEKLKCDISDAVDSQHRVKSHSESDSDGRCESALKIGASRKVRDINVDETRTSKLRARRHSEQKLTEYKTAEDKFRLECHDLYSSASDEGILSKELSSEEYLADKTDADMAKGLESEG